MGDGREREAGVIPPWPRIGSYEVIAELGAGGMGEVYRPATRGCIARWRSKSSRLRSRATRFMSSFRREARAVALLTHPNIVTIHSVEEANGVHLLTMELIEGRPLDRELPASGCSLAQLLEQAIALDPGFAPAHADLAGCVVHFTEQGRKPRHEAMPIAREYASRAIALDPTSPDGHHWLARDVAEYDYDWPLALRHHERATASGRLSPSARASLAQFVLVPLGRLEEAEREAEAAVAADPLGMLPRIHLGNVVLTYTAMGRRKDAIKVFEEAQPSRARETLTRPDTPECAVTRAVSYACCHIVCEQFAQAEHLLQAVADRSPWAPLMTTLNQRFWNNIPGRRVLDALGIPHS